MGYNIIFIIFSQSKLYTNKYIKYKNKFNLLTFYIDMYIKMVYNIVEDKGEKEKAVALTFTLPIMYID